MDRENWSLALPMLKYLINRQIGNEKGPEVKPNPRCAEGFPDGLAAKRATGSTLLWCSYAAQSQGFMT